MHQLDAILAFWLSLLTLGMAAHYRRDQKREARAERRWSRILVLLDRLDVKLDELDPQK